MLGCQKYGNPTYAATLLFFDRFSPSMAILDKAYDTDAVLAFFERQGAILVIPPKANRVVQRNYDRQLYK